MRCSPRTIELEEERLSLVKKHFGDVPLSAITASAIAGFQRTRYEAGIANRAINMDVGVPSRVLMGHRLASATVLMTPFLLVLHPALPCGGITVPIERAEMAEQGSDAS